MPSSSYFAKYALDFARNGYEIIEIKPGAKFTTRKGWEKAGLTPDQIAEFTAEGKGSWGVGILTRNTPLVDIDCYDQVVIDRLTAYIKRTCGLGLSRVGKAPKTGFVFRSSEPFTKVKSTIYLHDGKQQACEVLGDGQQFVAAAIHPDTKKPYRWADGRHPGTVETWELPTIDKTQAEAVVAEFERIVTELGWQVYTSTKSMTMTGSKVVAGDDEFADVTQVCGLSLEEIRDRVFKIPNDGLDGEADYDTWANIGMAIYHETDGSDEGFAIWDEWSDQSGKNETKGTKNRQKWNSFEIAGKGRAPITFRYVLKLTADAEQAVAEEKIIVARLAVAQAKTVTELHDAIHLFKKIDFAAVPLIYEATIDQIRKQFKRLEGTNMAAARVAKLIRFQDADRIDAPAWLEPFVYLVAPDLYLDRQTGLQLKPRSFDGAFSCELLTKQDRYEGKAVPEFKPTEYALNLVKIPRYTDSRYIPWADTEFTMDGVNYINRYSDRMIPAIPTSLTQEDRAAIATVEQHFEILIPNQRDRGLLLDWLAYIAQSRKRPNWAVLIQGTEGDGKTWIHEMMNEVLGHGNTRTVGAKRLTESFNAWAEGTQFIVFEEVRLPGHSSREIMDNIKTLITNSVIEIHPKGRDPFQAPNTAALLILTNYRDALTLTAGDSRYFPLFSRFQDEVQRERYFAENAGARWNDEKDYFSKLYASIHDHPGAIRKWLIERKLGSEFNAQARAPKSHSKAQMIALTKSPMQEATEWLIHNHKGEPDLCKELMNATKLLRLLHDEVEEGDIVPNTLGVRKLMVSMGYSYLCRIRMDGNRDRFWTFWPERFDASPEAQVRALLETEF